MTSIDPRTSAEQIMLDFLDRFREGAALAFPWQKNGVLIRTIPTSYDLQWPICPIIAQYWHEGGSIWISNNHVYSAFIDIIHSDTSDVYVAARMIIRAADRADSVWPTMYAYRQLLLTACRITPVGDTPNDRS